MHFQPNCPMEASKWSDSGETFVVTVRGSQNALLANKADHASGRSGAVFHLQMQP